MPARTVLVETGAGFNGKGVLKDLALSILGRSPDGYGLSAAFSSFVSSKITKPDAPRNDLVRWAGARFVTASESNSNQKCDSALLKMFTGGDQITYRGNFEEERESAPTAKIVLLTNFLPRIDDSSEAMWGRVKNCVFPVSIPEAERDPQLSDKLFRDESDIIFSWTVEGWRKYWTALKAGGQNPLPDSPAITANTANYRGEQNQVGRFFDDSYRLTGKTKDNSSGLPSSTVYMDYSAWCEAAGEAKKSRVSFSTEFERYGAKIGGIRKGVSGHSKSVVWYGFEAMEATETTTKEELRLFARA